MVFVEYDCSDSTAISRIAYNRGLKHLAVIFKENPKTYVYQNVPEKYIHGHSKGKLVAEIKKFTDYKEYDSFPRHCKKYVPPANVESDGNIPPVKQEPTPNAIPNEDNKKKGKHTEKKKTARKPKEFRDYSKEWLDLLDIPAVRQNRDYLTSLLPLFQGTHNSQYPMSIPPPPFDLPYDGNTSRPSNGNGSNNNRVSSRSRAAQFHAQRDNNAAPGRFESANTFAQLLDDEEEEDVDSEDELIKLTNQLHLDNTPANGAPSPTIQSRYLRVRIILLIVDFLRDQGIQAQKRPANTTTEKATKYADIRLYWTEAYELLHATSIELGEWFAIYYSYDGQENLIMPMPGHHDATQLTTLIDTFTTVQDHTEVKKTEALTYLEQRLDRLQKKLNPMLRERDEVKAQVGERRWKENPDPKFDYAEKRKEWEDEVKEITQTIATLIDLKFVK